jgi:hypothetical protein
MLIASPHGVETWVRYEPATSRCIVEPEGVEPEAIGFGKLRSWLPLAAKLIGEELAAPSTCVLANVS